MGKYTTVLLDIDMTVLDFNAAEASALRDAFGSMLLPIDDEVIARYHVINDALWKDFELGKVTKERLKYLRFARLVEALDIDADAAILQNVYADFLATKGIMLDGAREFLEEAARRYTLYAITNGISYVQKGRFEKADIGGYFKNVFISEDVGCGKPDKRYFDHVLASIDEKDKSMIAVVGDSLTSDIKGGKNCGMKTCFYNFKSRPVPDDIKPDYCVTDLKEILLIT